MNERTARPYRASDEANTLALRRRVFGQEMSTEMWRWKLRRNHGDAPKPWVITSGAGNDVLTFAGIAPVDLVVGGRVHGGAVLWESFTEPPQQRTGLQLSVLHAAHADWDERARHMFVCVPNEKLIGIFDKMGWTRLFKLQWLRAPLHVGDAIRRKAGAAGGLIAPLANALLTGRRPGRRTRLTRDADSDIEVRDGRCHVADFDRLWDAVGAGYPNLIVRDSPWVRWRLLEAPLDYRVRLLYRRGVPAGYVAYRIFRRDRAIQALVADLFTAPTDSAAAERLLAEALDESWAAGAEFLRALAAEGTPLFATLRRAGFWVAPGAFDVMWLDRSRPAPVPASIANATSWLLTGAEFDVV